ncbi:hypothetical protein FXE51_13635 [Vibrio mimicus]|nr:hypothetical protein FXE51_13635 [Vibrio mimicus]
MVVRNLVIQKFYIPSIIDAAVSFIGQIAIPLGVTANTAAATSSKGIKNTEIWLVMIEKGAQSSAYGLLNE